MTAAGEYLRAVRRRMTADGCAVTDERVGSAPAVVGYKAQMKALTRMHIFTATAQRDHVDPDVLGAYVDDVLTLALARKGKWRGLQSGVIVLPILLTVAADPAATALTQKSYRLNAGGFAAFAQPAVVDLAEGRVWTFRGTRLWGYAYNSLIKQKLTAYLPEPSAVGG